MGSATISRQAPQKIVHGAFADLLGDGERQPYPAAALARLEGGGRETGGDAVHCDRVEKLALYRGGHGVARHLARQRSGGLLGFSACGAFFRHRVSACVLCWLGAKHGNGAPDTGKGVGGRLGGSYDAPCVASR